MTLACRDAEAIPKAEHAGRIVTREGLRLQVMHDGTLVRAGGCHGPWMERIIRDLRGHHEPQAELVFHHLLRHCRPGTTIVDLGAKWARYTNWYLGAVPGSTAVCVEPDAGAMKCGVENLSFNGRSAIWVNASVSGTASTVAAVARAPEPQGPGLPCHTLDSLLDLVGARPIEILRLDVEGDEDAFLATLGPAVAAGLLRFVVVATHHVSISGSGTTHGDCLRLLAALGATILAEHTVEESFSGDGLVVASFHPADAPLPMPTVSLNAAAGSLFGRPQALGGAVRLVDTDNGPMLVRADDSVIGESLRQRGTFEEGRVSEVVRFLRGRCGFNPSLFIDVGANIGTHIVHALRGGLFAQGVGIEMDADNFRLLRSNLAINVKAGSWRLFDVALSDRVGLATASLDPSNFGDHRVVVEGVSSAGLYREKERRRATITVTTLDRLERDVGFLADEQTLVWIDTQGHEGHVLDGARSILARERPPRVVCEFWPYGLEQARGRERLFRFLRRCRSIHDIGVAGWQTGAVATVESLERLYDRLLAECSPEQSPHTELLCIP